jgi:flagellar protein FliS
MAHQTSLNGYQQNQVMHVSLEKVIVLLYEGAIAFTMQAQEAFRKGDLVTGGIKLLRARNIVSALRNGLDFEQGGELALNLNDLYLYAHDELLRANNEGNLARLDSVLNVLTTLKEGWQEVSQQSNQQTPPQTPSPQPPHPAFAPAAQSRGEQSRLRVSA